VKQYGLSAHLYVDDTQIYGFCPPSTVSSLPPQITTCVRAVADWMQANRLQLNCDKTDFLWLTNSRNQHRLPTSGLMIGSTSVTPTTTVCDLGVFIGADLSMRMHVQRTCSFTLLFQPASITQHLRSCADVCVPVVGYCTCPQPTGLFQQCAGRPTGQSYPTSAVSAKCCCSTHLQ